ncbi:MAG: DNA polymerase subunit beta [Hyperthermus sp.]|nr:MAG: DNA polymerase subunit beta [Hyperthermus sp.]
MSLLAERARMLREWREWIQGVVEAIKQLYPDAEIYVIGSIAEGNYTASSDLDLLVATSKPPQTPREEAETKTRIEELANLPVHHPLEIHFVYKERKETWLKHSKNAIRLA